LIAHGQILPNQNSAIPEVLENALGGITSRSKMEMASGFYDKKPTQCVPYARQVSGFQIYGNAHTWWNQAKNKGYERGIKPKEGSVLVLKKGHKLSLGHVAVVNEVLSDREMNVAHSNWGNNTKKRSFIYESMRVRDVSARNDWSELRFWNKYSKAYGSIYPNHGFIYPPLNVASSE